MTDKAATPDEYLSPELAAKLKADFDQAFTPADLTALRKQYEELLARADRLVEAERQRQANSLETRRSRARDGLYNGGQRPYGFIWIEEEERWVPVTSEVAVLTEIKQRRDSGESLPAIARALNNQQIPTPKRGARWYPATVWKLLNNEFYQRHSAWGDIEADISANVKAARATAATGVFGEK